MRYLATYAALVTSTEVQWLAYFATQLITTRESWRTLATELFFVFCFLSHFYLPASGCGLRCRPFSPPVRAFSFLSRTGFSILTARRLSSNVANSRPRASRESICAQEKVPANLYEYALRGTRTHAIDL